MGSARLRSRSPGNLIWIGRVESRSTYRTTNRSSLTLLIRDPIDTIISRSCAAASLAGFHSIRVNKQWRLVFQWDGSRGEVESIYLDDHSYR